MAADGPRRLVYTVIKGITVRNYRAEVTLTPAGDRTLGGRIVHRKLRTLYPAMITQLVAAADHGVPASPDTRRAG